MHSFLTARILLKHGLGEAHRYIHDKFRTKKTLPAIVATLARSSQGMARFSQAKLS